MVAPHHHHQSPRVWCFIDGKPGHENQTLGLVEALGRFTKIPFDVHQFQVSRKYTDRFLGFGNQGRLDETPSPDLVIGAGHATHIALWRARKKYGGRSVVLMKPSLPLRLFDLCLIPDAHEISDRSDRVVLTRGVLNRIQPSNRQRSDRGICLIGGPSSHFEWSDDSILAQIRKVIQTSDAHDWIIATSRRTTEHLRTQLCSQFPSVKIVFPEDVDRDWLPSQLQHRGTVWVSEDSVSMTYEAVTSGARVGLLELPKHRSTRVTKGVERLVEDQQVTRFCDWQETGRLLSPASNLCESNRAARVILKRFLPHLLRPEFAAASPETLDSA